MLYATAWQTVGPFLHIGLDRLNNDSIALPGVAGEPLTIEGRLVDGEGRPVPDGLIELWQANSHGRYAHPEDTRDLPLEPNFSGFARRPTDAEGAFRFRTVRPGRVPDPTGALQAPHILVAVFARGILRRMVTRIYFPGEAANAEDPVLARVPAERRSTLIATPTGQAGVLCFNVVLQGSHLGQGETVFFEI